MQDFLHKYLLSDRSLRVQTVQLEQTWADAREHHHYPSPVQRILGELSVASVLLASNLKFNGSLVLQIQGDGPVSLVVVECNSNLQVRATVKLRPEMVIRQNATFQEMVNPGGSGHFMVILDLNDRKKGQQPYQGIVDLHANSIAQMLQNYMKTSEQLDTRLCLAADTQKACGLLLQKLPTTGGHEVDAQQANDNWERISQFVSTVTPQELLSVDDPTLLHRLFWEDTLLFQEDHKVQWFCPCTRQAVGNMLKMLGTSEVESILEEQGLIRVSCEFCGKEYTFDPIQAAQLFMPDSGYSQETKH